MNWLLPLIPRQLAPLLLLMTATTAGAHAVDWRYLPGVDGPWCILEGNGNGLTVNDNNGMGMEDFWDIPPWEEEPGASRGFRWVSPRIITERQESFEEDRTAIRLANQSIDDQQASTQALPGADVGGHIGDAFSRVPITLDFGIRYDF